MSKAATTASSIHKAAEQRAAEWAAHPATDVFRVRHLTDKLEGLYERLRLERARGQHGDPAEIRRRARIEREIERLMSDNGE